MAVVGQPLQFTLHATDGDQDPLTFSALGLPGRRDAHAPASTYGEAVVTWTPTAADVGRYAVLPGRRQRQRQSALAPERSADDSRSSCAPATRRRAGCSAADQTVAEGQTLTVQLQATDPDGDPVTYSAANLPPGRPRPAHGNPDLDAHLFQAGTLQRHRPRAPATAT